MKKRKITLARALAQMCSESGLRSLTRILRKVQKEKLGDPILGRLCEVADKEFQTSNFGKQHGFVTKTYAGGANASASIATSNRDAVMSGCTRRSGPRLLHECARSVVGQHRHPMLIPFMLVLLALACAGCAYAPYSPKCVWWIAQVSTEPDVKAVVIIMDGKTHWKQLP